MCGTPTSSDFGIFKRQRLETLTPSTSSACTCTGAARAGTGARTGTTASASSAPRTTCGGWLWRGIRHVGDAGGEVLHVADHLLGEGLYAADHGSSKIRAG